MAENVDVVVIGMGPGGEDAAGRLAAAGLSVVGIDARLLGGECPYYGCVPSKMMIRAADALAEARRVPQFAGTDTVEADWTKVADRVRDEATDNWDDAVAVKRFTDKGGRFVRGRARLSGPRTVSVNGEDFTAGRAIVLNTGTEPNVPPITGLTDTPYWTNREAITTREVPASLCVLGGGAIGLELALVFARFGSKVTVVEAGERLLALEEPEAGKLLAEVFTDEGLTVRTGSSAKSVSHDGNEFTVDLSDGQVRADALLVATGRRTNLADIGLETVGLDPKARFLDPDEWMRVADGVWAVGDITGKGAFTHVSMYQADVAVRDILGQGGPAAEYHALPRVTFTDPEVGAVGITEEQAREQGLNVRVGLTDLAYSTRGFIHRAKGLIKVVEDADAGVLVGATAAGPSGGEVLSALAVAVHGRVPTDRLASMIYAYPTFHRAIQSAIADLH
jgi:pyruvate/2-oxoglutarate dehydrogenase complex dihydrolipoamide dehydrogenase (E3) component